MISSDRNQKERNHKKQVNKEKQRGNVQEWVSREDMRVPGACGWFVTGQFAVWGPAAVENTNGKFTSLFLTHWDMKGEQGPD